MPHTVTVKDYYANDYNGLWSWYLANLRKGEFEELTGNILKFSLLKRFLKEYFYKQNNIGNGSGSNEGGNTDIYNKKMLLVSIPDKIHNDKDIGMLESFLRDYFKLDDLKNIKIQKLTSNDKWATVYNHENHYLIMDPLNNFHDEKLLGHHHHHGDNEGVQEGHGNSFTSNNSSSGSRHIEKYISHANTIVVDGENGDSRSEASFSTNSTGGSSSSSNSSSESDGSEDENALEIDFQHHRRDTLGQDDVHAGQSQHEDKEKEQCCKKTESTTVEIKNSVGNIKSNRNAGHRMSKNYRQMLFAAHGGDTDTASSINSFNYTTDDDFGEELHQVDTRDDFSYDPSDSVSYDPSEEYDMELAELDDDDDDDHDDVYSMSSIFPSISISNNQSKFRLVLQSILIENPDFDVNDRKSDGLIMNTAIRQSNMDPSVASVHDDWLLYDAEFNINNLQMLTLNEVLSVNRYCPKMLFYTMVDLSETPAPALTMPAETESDSANENGDGEIEDYDADHYVSNYGNGEHSPEQSLYTDSRSDYSQDVNSDQISGLSGGVRLYNANTNITTARGPYVIDEPSRPLATTAMYTGDNGIYTYSDDEHGRDSGLTPKFVDVNADKKGTGSKNSSGQISRGLSKVLTLGSLNLVERSKTLPPTTTTSSTIVSMQKKQENSTYKKLLNKRKKLLLRSNNNKNKHKTNEVLDDAYESDSESSETSDPDIEQPLENINNTTGDKNSKPKTAKTKEGHRKSKKKPNSSARNNNGDNNCIIC